MPNLSKKSWLCPAVAVALGLVAGLFSACRGGSLDVAYDPGTGLPVVKLWWSPEDGRCTARPHAGGEPIEIVLPPAVPPGE